MIGFRQASEEDQATQFALWRGIILVLVPGLAFVVCIIALVIRKRPPISTLNGCYHLGAFPLIRVGPGLISVEKSGIGAIPMSVEKGKEGYVINAERGFSFKTTAQRAKQAVSDYPQGELIPVFISQSKAPALGLISDGEQIEIPKVDCPR